MDLNAVASHDLSCYPSECRAIIAGIVSDGDRSSARHGLQHVIGEALGRLGDGVGIHAVGADAHEAAQATGAKLEVGVKGFHQRFSPFIE